MLSRLAEIASLFLKLGIIGFGGPAAHIAMMEEEVVTRRKWISRQHFLDLVGATNLIPGPNSTEMAIHVGFQRAGILGLITSGVCFIFPAVFLTCVLAWVYHEYEKFPEFDLWTAGIHAAVPAIIAAAGYRLGRKVFKTKKLLAIGIIASAVLLCGIDAIWCLLGVSAVGGIWLLLTPQQSKPALMLIFTGSFWQGLLQQKAYAAISLQKAQLCPLLATAAYEANNEIVWKVGLFFLKVGAILYGGGYVLIAYLRDELVGQYGFTEQQLYDAIAIGQFTPGPILSTASFVGYQIAGIPGAIVSTLGIFLPSFVVVAIANPIIPKLRKSKVFSKILDAVNATSIGLLLGETTKIALKQFIGWDTNHWRLPPVLFQSPESFFTFWPKWLIFATSLLCLIRYQVSAFWIVIGGALLGAALASI